LRVLVALRGELGDAQVDQTVPVERQRRIVEDRCQPLGYGKRRARTPALRPDDDAQVLLVPAVEIR
jgi:hypothetical protein